MLSSDDFVWSANHDGSQNVTRQTTSSQNDETFFSDTASEVGMRLARPKSTVTSVQDELLRRLRLTWWPTLWLLMN